MITTCPQCGLAGSPLSLNEETLARCVRCERREHMLFSYGGGYPPGGGGGGYGGGGAPPQGTPRCQLGHDIAPGASYCPQGHPIAIDSMPFAPSGDSAGGYSGSAGQGGYGGGAPPAGGGYPQQPQQGYPPAGQQGYPPAGQQGYPPAQPEGYNPQQPAYGGQPAPGAYPQGGGYADPNAGYASGGYAPAGGQSPSQQGGYQQPGAYAPPPAASAYGAPPDPSQPGAQQPVVYEPSPHPPQLGASSLRGFLVSYQTNVQGEFWPLFGGRMAVGRANSGEQVDVALNDATISSKHAAVVVDGQLGTVVVEDRGSTNGTYVNEEHIGYSGRRELKDGDKLRFGGYTTYVKIVRF